MKKFWLTLALVLTMIGGFSLITLAPVTAQAATQRMEIPKSLRGHWRLYDKGFHHYEMQIFTKWESKNTTAGFKIHWFTMSGKSNKTTSTQSPLQLQKVGKGYRISPKDDLYPKDWAVWTRVKHHGKTALHSTYPGALVKTSGAYYYRYK